MDNTILFDKLATYGADIDGINGRFMGNKELYETCFDEFLNEPNFSKLDISIQKHNYNETFEAAHTLKGVTGNLGLTPIYEIFCSMVALLRAKEYDKVRIEYGKMKDEMNKIVSLINE